MQTPLVSIIIPTYNRAHLIGETLDSVLAQTYTNWECIIVDDGSTDHTDQVLGDYCKKDTRFQYHHRPKDRLPGGNAARNYGFELSKGEYVNWFDSDDLMLKNFINHKIKKIKNTNLDFVFSKSMNFGKNNLKESMYVSNNIEKQISPFNFVTKTLTWCTLDFLARKDSLNEIFFNEKLFSGQEYNFFTRYLCLTNKGLFINEFLTLRRIHQNSIQENQRKSKQKYRLQKYSVYLLTYEDIMNVADNKSLEYLLGMAMSNAFSMAHHNEKIPFFLKLTKFILKQNSLFSSLLFVISILSSYSFKKGYVIMNFSRNFKIRNIFNNNKFNYCI